MSKSDWRCVLIWLLCALGFGEALGGRELASRSGASIHRHGDASLGLSRQPRFSNADAGQADIPGVDGRLTPAEKSLTTLLKMSRGGSVYARLSGDLLYAAVESPVGGFGNVCISSDKKMRLLHASAALGDAEFEHSGSVWVRSKSFVWALRDSSREPAPTDEQRRAHLDSRGWLANSRNAPTVVREFLVRVRPDEQHVAFSFVETAGGSEVGIAPAGLKDGCADPEIMRGFLPPTATFTPVDWVSLASLKR